MYNINVSIKYVKLEIPADINQQNKKVPIDPSNTCTQIVYKKVPNAKKILKFNTISNNLHFDLRKNLSRIYINMHVSY